MKIMLKKEFQCSIKLYYKNVIVIVYSLNSERNQFARVSDKYYK